MGYPDLHSIIGSDIILSSVLFILAAKVMWANLSLLDRAKAVCGYRLATMVELAAVATVRAPGDNQRFQRTDVQYTIWMVSPHFIQQLNYSAVEHLSPSLAFTGGSG